MGHKTISFFIFTTSLVLLILHIIDFVEVDIMVFGLLGFMSLSMIKEIMVQWKDVTLGLSINTDELEVVRLRSESFKSLELPKRQKHSRMRQKIKQIISVKDPKTRLTEIRLDITDKLNQLADLNGMGNLDFSIGYLTPRILEMKSLGDNDAKFLHELLLNLNSSLKSNKPNEDILKYVEKIYPTVIQVLTEKIEETRRNKDEV